MIAGRVSMCVFVCVCLCVCVCVCVFTGKHNDATCLGVKVD